MRIKDVVLRVVIAGAAMLLFAACSPLSAATVSPTDVEQTDVVRFEPALPTAEKPGACWVNSVSVARVDAWRCMVEENDIYDPCFYLEAEDAVVCGALPGNETDAFRVQLTEPLPVPDVPAEQMTADASWALELADGTFCQRFTGATGPVDQKPITFGCVPTGDAGDTSSRTVILGEPQTGVVWTVEKAVVNPTADGIVAEETSRVPVRTAWR